MTFWKKKELSEHEIELEEKFKNSFAREASKRLVFLLGLVIISQLTLFLAQILGVASNNHDLLVMRIGIVAGGIVFSLVLTRIRKATEKSGKTKLLSTMVLAAQLIMLGFGCHFTAYLFSLNIYSFSVFIIVSLLIFLTRSRWPIAFSAFLLLIYVALAIYININYDVPFYYVDDSHTVFWIVVLISTVNLLYYKILRVSFLKEMRIKEMNDKLVELSERDALTGLYNRRHIIGALQEQIKLSERYKSKFCVAMLDLDHFKKINDRFGHNIGDDVLKELSDLIQNNLRESDILGRWGGEEFIIVLPQTDEGRAYTLVDRIREIVDKYEFETVGNATFSAGVCEFKSGFIDDDIIGKADYAMYLSKQLGRNMVSVADAA